MIQIGIPEFLLLIGVIFFSVKPEKIIYYLRSFLKVFFNLKTKLEIAKTEIESELNISELKQDIFNEKKMEEFKKNHDQG